MPLIRFKSPQLQAASRLRCLRCLEPGIRFLICAMSAGVQFKLLQKSCWS